jgi:putative membrane protein
MIPLAPSHSEHAHADAGWLEAALPVAVLLLVGIGYLVLVRRAARDIRRGWNPWRTASFLTGIVLLVVAVSSSLSPFPEGDFRAHMFQHLLIGMYAPLALVLGAPVTLLLRTIPRRHGRILGRMLRSGPMKGLAHPVTALLLNLGGLALLYCTSLYQATMQQPILHHLIHIHFLVTGYLFAYAIAGPDPAPHRPSVPARLVILGVAIAAHAFLAQLIYAGIFIQVPASAGERRGAADLMYYGGDIAELLLALALVSTWRPTRRRDSGDRRAQSMEAVRRNG